MAVSQGDGLPDQHRWKNVLCHQWTAASPGPSGALRTRFVALPAGRRFILVTDQPMLGNDYVYETSFGADPTRPVEEFFRHNKKILVLWADSSVSAASYEELMTNRFDLNKSLWKYQ